MGEAAGTAVGRLRGDGSQGLCCASVQLPLVCAVASHGGVSFPGNSDQETRLGRSRACRLHLGRLPGERDGRADAGGEPGVSRPQGLTESQSARPGLRAGQEGYFSERSLVWRCR